MSIPLGTILLVLLVLMLLGAIPSWPHSKSWGYGPSGALGIAELTPQKISVTIQGPRRVLQNLIADKMHAYADLSGLDYGEHVVDVSWVFPSGITLKDDKRVQVNAIIRRGK